MPEFRQNLATKEWVIISPERARRPHEFKPERKKKAPPSFVRDCPFCPGNEAMATPPAMTLGKGRRWRVRVIGNKFPALVPGAPEPYVKGGLYRVLPGEGVHEVIIDSPAHDDSPAIMERAHLEDLLGVYRERFLATLKSGKIAMTLIFKNHGAAAGTSLDHPHSQMIGSSVVPAGIRHRMDEAQRYFDQTSTCVFCRMIEEERAQEARILADTRHFCAFMLFAALSPFHLWILPKRHTPSFGEITAEERKDLSAVLGGLLRKIRAGLNDPAYNYIIQSAPLDRGTTEPYHWYLSLIVRTSRAAGFELGSGIYINTAAPEESARFLNAVRA